VDVEVRRMAPLSLSLRQMGPEPLAGTLMEALAILVDETTAAAA
jgi:hypothetical protein